MGPVPPNAASAMTTNASGTRQIIPIKPNKVDAKSQRKINKQLSENRINIFCQKEKKEVRKKFAFVKM
jgi:hypothetical protein